MPVVVSLLFLLFSCYSHPEPQWISNQPAAENYWFGMGSIEKPFYGDDIREEARSKAYNEIASQISIDISSSFEHLVTETNLSIDEFSSEAILVMAALRSAIRFGEDWRSSFLFGFIKKDPEPNC